MIGNVKEIILNPGNHRFYVYNKNTTDFKGCTAFLDKARANGISYQGMLQIDGDVELVSIKEVTMEDLNDKTAK